MSSPIDRAFNDLLTREVKRKVAADRAKLVEKLKSGGRIEGDDIRLLEPHEWSMWTVAEMFGPALASIDSHLESIDSSLRILAGRPATTAEEAEES